MGCINDPSENFFRDSALIESLGFYATNSLAIGGI